MLTAQGSEGWYSLEDKVYSYTESCYVVWLALISFLTGISSNHGSTQTKNLMRLKDFQTFITHSLAKAMAATFLVYCLLLLISCVRSLQKDKPFTIKWCFMGQLLAWTHDYWLEFCLRLVVQLNKYVFFSMQQKQQKSFLLPLHFTH